MVNLTIDGREITVKENTTIMEAASQNGIPIPKLCYLKGINEIAACRVCVVELEGKEKLIPHAIMSQKKVWSFIRTVRKSEDTEEQR